MVRDELKLGLSGQMWEMGKGRGGGGFEGKLGFGKLLRLEGEKLDELQFVCDFKLEVQARESF
jgi:hypothetical protein